MRMHHQKKLLFKKIPLQVSTQSTSTTHTLVITFYSYLSALFIRRGPKRPQVKRKERENYAIIMVMTIIILSIIIMPLLHHIFFLFYL